MESTIKSNHVSQNNGQTVKAIINKEHSKKDKDRKDRPSNYQIIFLSNYLIYQHYLNHP